MKYLVIALAVFGGLFWTWMLLVVLRGVKDELSRRKVAAAIAAAQRTSHNVNNVDELNAYRSSRAAAREAEMKRHPTGGPS